MFNKFLLTFHLHSSLINLTKNVGSDSTDHSLNWHMKVVHW